MLCGCLFAFFIRSLNVERTRRTHGLDGILVFVLFPVAPSVVDEVVETMRQFQDGSDEGAEGKTDNEKHREFALGYVSATGIQSECQRTNAHSGVEALLVFRFDTLSQL